MMRKKSVWLSCIVIIQLTYYNCFHLFYFGKTKLSDQRLSLFLIPSLGGLPPCQQDCCCGNRRLLSSWPQLQEGHVLWHQPVQQPCALLGSSADHLPLRLRPLRHPARQLQEEVERPACLLEEVCVCKWVCESFVSVRVWPQPHNTDPYQHCLSTNDDVIIPRAHFKTLVDMDLKHNISYSLFSFNVGATVVHTAYRKHQHTVVMLSHTAQHS